MPRPLVLIASNEFDRPVTAPVVRFLEEDHGCEVVLYEADRVAGQKVSFGFAITNKGLGAISYGNRTFRIDDIGAAWYRRPNTFSPALDEDPAKMLSLNRERSAAQVFWDAIDPNRWLNAPQAMRQADRKLSQLLAAQSLGFIIPETVVSNDWSRIQSDLTAHSEAIVKMHNGQLHTAEGLRVMYTKHIPDLKAPHLQGLNPFPGIWQESIPGARQWRVTIVGNQVFAASVYQSHKARYDWREYQGTSEIEFKAEPFPDECAKRCLKLKDKLGLKGFAAIDLAERADGEMIFFEVNPNGQYGWIEDDLDMPISAAIAGELARIAHSKLFTRRSAPPKP